MLNKIKLGLVALLLPLVAFAQSYPSPTFNNLTVQGTFTATGKVTLASLATQAANTVVANVTGSAASPTAVAIPSCSTANSALQYTSGTGLSCGAAFALTSGTLAQFAATTSAQLLGVISDETGSGSLVFGTGATIGTATINTPTISGGTINNATLGITTPLAAKVTTLQATSTITPSTTAGIVGTATNDSANAGSIGEFICAQVTNGGSPTGCATNSSTPVSLSTSTPANVTSISLTAGDWDIWGSVAFLAAGGTTTGTIQCSPNSVSATLATAPNGGAYALTNLPATAGLNGILPCGMARFSLASTTTVFLVASSIFSGSTETAYGFLGARRRR
ncbi:hypothetical protein [Paraburkholderia sediminicola]|uniref:hypothetical protein n=1 Tax=Paraburkholderia sediminicola TaxID=458836 RepID=UPI0038BD229F